MKTQTHEYVTITAEEGYFLTNHNGLYGTEIVLGANDSPENYEELPLSEWPETTNVTSVEEETDQTELSQEEILARAKALKLKRIEEYDTSDSVNGFYYNNQFMWLNKETRACLKNTIESFSLVGRDNITIWYKSNEITLDLESAKILLASLEVYATDCYNITERHKRCIIEMTNIEEVSSFDITSDYPDMPRFNC